ncbi:MAG: amidohydrolase family protein [Candidatus Hodarchaeales archaeon]|jgi:predicted TIM-barrel fold metal-dependent hydrolase
MNKNNVEKAVILGMDLHEETLDNSNWRKYFEKQLEFMIFDQDQIIEAMRFILKNGHTPNDYVSELQKNYPERFIGFGSVQLGYQNKSYITKKLKEIVNLDLKGIKLLPTLQFYNPAESKRLESLFKFAEKHNLITLIHTGCDPGPWEYPVLSKNGNPELLYPIIKKFPEVPIILAHLGSYSAKSPAIWFKETLRLFQSLPDNKLYGDISAVPYLIEKERFLNLIKTKIGFEKILFGSDFPVTSTSLKELIDPVLNNNFLSQGEKFKILYENANKILFQN